MKKVFAAFLASLLVCLSSVMIVSAYDGSDRLIVEAPKATATVDGVMDNVYGPLYTVEQLGVASTDGLELTTGKVAVCWDDEKLYIYCEVYDNNEPYAVSTTDWMCDGPEFFFDLMHDMSDSYSDDDFRVRVIAAYDQAGSIWENPLSYNGSNSNAAVLNATDDDFELAIKLLGSKWSDGYAVELSYKYSNYGYSYSAGDLIGWEVQIVDDMFGFGSRDTQAFLGNPADVAWGNPSQFGSDIKLIADTSAVEEPAVTEAPAVDIEVTTAPTVTTAPQTGDIAVITLMASFVSLGVAVVSKKRG